MTTEFYWLTLTALMTALFWLPYVLDRYVVRGFWPAFADTQPEGTGPQSVWARRAIRAHQNAIENLAIFAPLVLTAHLLHLSTHGTKMAAALYFFSRLAHFIVYTAGLPTLRTFAFTGGFVAQIIFVVTILRGI